MLPIIVDFYSPFERKWCARKWNLSIRKQTTIISKKRGIPVENMELNC